MIQSLFLISLAYCMGSICSAIVVCRLFSLPDPRLAGSKNPGATNVLRLSGKQYAAYVIFGDLLKGTIPVMIAKYLDADLAVVGFTALAAVVGHIFPVFFSFKGGKGVATAIGAFLGFNFIFGIMVSVTWLVLVNITRYASLASIVAVGLAPLYSLVIVRGPNLFPPLFFIAILVVYQHRNNITRLMDGTEPKLRLKHSILEDAMEPSFESPHEPFTADEPSVQQPTKKNTGTRKKSAKTSQSKEQAQAAAPKSKTVKPKLATPKAPKAKKD